MKAIFNLAYVALMLERMQLAKSYNFGALCSTCSKFKVSEFCSHLSMYVAILTITNNVCISLQGIFKESSS